MNIKSQLLAFNRENRTKEICIPQKNTASSCKYNVTLNKQDNTCPSIHYVTLKQIRRLQTPSMQKFN